MRRHHPTGSQAKRFCHRPGAPTSRRGIARPRQVPRASRIPPAYKYTFVRVKQSQRHVHSTPIRAAGRLPRPLLPGFCASGTYGPVLPCAEGVRGVRYILLIFLSRRVRRPGPGTSGHSVRVGWDHEALVVMFLNVAASRGSRRPRAFIRVFNMPRLHRGFDKAHPSGRSPRSAGAYNHVLPEP
jgi:hypothetical protein